MVRVVNEQFRIIHVRIGMCESRVLNLVHEVDETMRGRKTRNSRFFLYNFHACYEDMTVWAEGDVYSNLEACEEGRV